MNKIYKAKYFIVFLITVIVYSCKPSEDVTKVKVPHHSTKELLDSLDHNELRFKTLSAKAQIEYINEKTTSFKVHLRIQKDSAIWVSITPLFGIEMARVLITQDSVIFMDRVHSEYFKGDFGYINKMFNVELDFEMLQALLIGNSLEFEKNGKIRTSIDRKKDFYYIGTQKKRKVKKDLKKDKEKLKEQSQIIWLAPHNFKIVELFITDPEKNQSLRGLFSEHKMIQEQLFPYHLQFNIHSKKNLQLNVDYGKVSLNKAVSFSFKIPSKYDQIQ